MPQHRRPWSRHPIRQHQERHDGRLCETQWTRVAHSVIGETRDGYLVQGVNNDEADSDVVNEQNLVGVIVQAYAQHRYWLSIRTGPARRRARSSDRDPAYSRLILGSNHPSESCVSASHLE